MYCISRNNLKNVKDCPEIWIIPEICYFLSPPSLTANLDIKFIARGRVYI